MSKLLHSSRPLRIRRPLAMKGARVIANHLVAFWAGDRIFRHVVQATGDHKLAARVANRVYYIYRELVGRAS
jgi:hypothetical protein